MSLLLLLRTIVLALCPALAILFHASRASAQQSSDRPIGPAPGSLKPAAGEHPLAPIIRWGEAALPALRGVSDYQALLVRREFLGGRLGKPEYVTLKVRHHPFSVYAATLAGDRHVTQEAVYVDGRNDGMMWVHSDRYRYLGTMAMFPDARQVMRENRYPVTSVGLVNLVERLVAVAKEEVAADPCDVEIIEETRINGRPSLCVIATHPEQAPGMKFHKVRLFIDRAWNVPVRYESFWFPQTAGGKPQLMEEYTYLNLAFEQGLTDNDFDITNPAYEFPPPEDESTEAQIAGADEPVAADPPPAHPAATPTRWLTFRPTGDGHPLRPVLQLLDVSSARLAEADDYTCVLSKRERINGLLTGYEHMILRVRQAPEAMAVQWLGRNQPSGRQAFYQPQIDPGTMLLRPSRRGALIRVRLTDPLAMRGTRRTVSDLELARLVARLQALYRVEIRYAECDVRYVEGARLDGRAATCVVVTHPRPRTSFRWHSMRLFFDTDLNVLSRFEAYSWPKSGGAAPLEEEYTYRQIDLDAGLTDRDLAPPADGSNVARR